MDNSMLGSIEVNEENYLSLVTAYRRAVHKNLVEFNWKGNVIITGFAKYVLEYMETFPVIKPLIRKPSD